MRDAIGSPGRILLDVRTWDEYRGERFWPSGGLEPGGRAGHVPSAVHQPIDGLYDERGSFLDIAGLRGIFSAAALDGGEEMITYCTIGGRACTAWFVLSCLLGRDHVRVYDGSWAEWGRMAGAPVEQSLSGWQVHTDFGPAKDRAGVTRTRGEQAADRGVRGLERSLGTPTRPVLPPPASPASEYRAWVYRNWPQVPAGPSIGPGPGGSRLVLDPAMQVAGAVAPPAPGRRCADIPGAQAVSLAANMSSLATV